MPEPLKVRVRVCQDCDLFFDTFKKSTKFCLECRLLRFCEKQASTIYPKNIINLIKRRLSS